MKEGVIRAHAIHCHPFLPIPNGVCVMQKAKNGIICKPRSNPECNGNSAQVGEEEGSAGCPHPFSFSYLRVDELPMVGMEGLKVNWSCSHYVRKYTIYNIQYTK